jgi:alkanesulfonate monooxygenase SsuD/methylene tetrahydromethanopterin reductase-like flavin-dependent oxidoreductase (luciferase family)
MWDALSGAKCERGVREMKIGYFLSSEEWSPRDLISQAVNAEQAGFEGLWISDHYHPWATARSSGR